MTLNRTRVHLAYESGLELDGEYTMDDEVRWLVTGGPGAGTEGSARLRAVETSPGVYFCNWVEESGTTVSQVLDLRQNRVLSFMTYTTPDGRHGELQQGTALPL